MPAPVRPSSGSRPAQAEPLHDFSGLVTCRDDYQTLLRRFVKSDDYVMKDFLKLMLTSPADHGILRYVTSYEGFTLADLVSYNDRHNEANGEFGLDGSADNYSWNCGEEGETEDAEVLALRQKQVRNFLTLLLLSRGTPMIWQGDERGNSQGGNNNAYCQDNETSWIDWTPTTERRELTAFAAKLIAFRKEHKVFTGTKPFQYIDYMGIGHPDLSLHGAEAWNPDLGPFSHSIGLAFCENYAENDSRETARRFPAFTYLAINMYWKELPLALPKLPPHYVWKVFMDTDLPGGWCAVLYEGVPLGGGKISGGKIKNHYPKGLRNI
jgi:glycogen operon protein